MTIPEKRTVRIIVGATVLWICVLQYILFAVGRGEPYPALALPGFPARCPGCLLETPDPTAQEPALHARFADGSTRQIAVASVLPPGPSVRLIAFSTAFKDDHLTSRPNVVDWLRSRVARQFPGEAVTGLDIEWRTARYLGADASKTEYQPSHTIHLDFTGAS